MALKIATDAVMENHSDDRTQHMIAVKEVLLNPRKLKDIDINQYRNVLDKTGQGNMCLIIDLIIEELQHPFKDPRTYRTPSKNNITNERLFYWLIDESERTFKRGIIVTATVVRVLDEKVLCKLENGLDGIIAKNDIIGSTTAGNKKL